MNRGSAFSLLLALLLVPALHGQLPPEPLSIQPGTPQFVHDAWVVDNHWAIRYKRQHVARVFHPLTKHPDAPFAEFASQKPSYVCVLRDQDANGDPLFRIYYQANHRIAADDQPGPKYRTDIAYAESPDGLTWARPDLNLFPGKSHAVPNNIVIGIPDRPELESNAPFLLENVPAKDRRGFRHLLLYRVTGRGSGDLSGIHLIGSEDGIHFDPFSDERIVHLHSDAPNSIIYDPAARDYVLFCRAKQLYRKFKGDMIDTGASRRIATMRSRGLWTEWMDQGSPQTLLVPDATDSETHHNFFYGMPTVHRHGLYWGALEVFRMNDFIHTELVTSRDGVHWFRLPSRPKLIEYEEDGTWDDTMIFTSPAWIENGDEWWFYYTGWDGPHGTSERSSTVGLATCKRERLYSLRGPQGGGVVATRTLIWPGGDLWLNAASVPDAPGETSITVRVSDPLRKPIATHDHGSSRIDDTKPTRQRVTWDGVSMDEFRGKEIRLEFYLQNADLFSFGATP